MASVLVVDDDKVHSHLVAGVLRGKAYKVQNAFDAVQGLMLAMRTPRFDAIVLDMSMPGGSGEDLLMKLKRSSKTSGIPVIILSGSIDPAGQARARELGADAVLSKPLVPEDLIAALSAALA